MSGIVLLKPPEGHGCDACFFPTRHMASIRIINPFGAQYMTDACYCWPCYERWLEDSDHRVEVSLPEHSRPTVIAPTYNMVSGPYAINATYWRRAE